MRTRLLFLLAMLFAMPVVASAQLPFVIEYPANDTLELQTVVGQSVTGTALLTRLDQGVETLAILDLERPFSTPANPVTFQFADSLAVSFTFTPEAAGLFEVTVEFSTGGYRVPLVLRGTALDTTPRYTITPAMIDLGFIASGQSVEGSFVIENIWNEAIGLSWPNSPITLSIDGEDAAGVFLPAGMSMEVTFAIAANDHPSGDNALTIPIVDGSEVELPDPQQTRTVIVSFYAGRDTPPVRVEPALIEFTRVNTEPYESQQFTVTNLSDLDIVVDSVRFEPSDALRAILSAKAPTSFPVVITGGSTVTFTVDCEAAASGIISGWIDIWGRWLAETDAYQLSALEVMVVDTIRDQAPPIVMTMTTNDAKVGELCRATFTNESDLPSDLDHGIITLSYNATVLIPKSEPLDAEDPISNGRRTSRFILTPMSHSSGGVAGEIEFIVALGNASNTSLEVAGIEWRTADSASLGLPTQINGTVVSVIDGDGFEINVNPGPLSISVAPIPAAEQTTIRYQRDAAVPTTLRMYDRTGARVRDLSGQLTDAEGEIVLNVADLPAGSYFLQMHGGPYTYVTMVLIE